MKILFSKDIRNIEENAENLGFNTLRMMENAGSAVANNISEKFNVKGASVIILAGNGNNGGDGFVAARKLYEAGANVSVILVNGMPKSTNASQALSKLSNLPVRVYNTTDFECRQLFYGADFIIDAIFGIGFHGILSGEVYDLVEIANNTDAKRIAIDLPSGCECDTGKVEGLCFNADITISFIAVKPCHVLCPASDYCGKLVMISIGISKEIIEKYDSDITIIDDAKVKKSIPKIRKSSHKGSRGTSYLICGSYGTAGAAILSAKAALRSGVGLVKLALPKNIYPIVATALPEAVYTPCEESAEGGIVTTSIDKIWTETQDAESILIGCGCGKSKDFFALAKSIIENSKTPLVIDADGINAVSTDINILLKSNAQIVLTPHPAELARLLNVSTEYIQANRFAIAKAFATKFGVTLVLKGSNTVVALKDGSLYVCMHGNPGMASGGSGDVLAGIIVSLIAQGLPAELAAVCGVNIHAATGDLAATKLSAHSLLPSDIIEYLPQLFKKIEA